MLFKSSFLVSLCPLSSIRRLFTIESFFCTDNYRCTRFIWNNLKKVGELLTPAPATDEEATTGVSEPQPCVVSALKTPSSTELPENLSVLVTYGDAIVRKISSRSIRRVAPTWTIR